MRTKLFKGISGKIYEFYRFEIGTEFIENLEGNYIFVRELGSSFDLNNNFCLPIYIGEGNLNDRINFRINDGQIFRKRCNYVYVHKNSSHEHRKAEESDLLAGNHYAYAPTGLNIKIGG